MKGLSSIEEELKTSNKQQESSLGNMKELVSNHEETLNNPKKETFPINHLIEEDSK